MALRLCSSVRQCAFVLAACGAMFAACGAKLLKDTVQPAAHRHEHTRVTDGLADDSRKQKNCARCLKYAFLPLYTFMAQWGQCGEHFTPPPNLLIARRLVL